MSLRTQPAASLATVDWEWGGKSQAFCPCKILTVTCRQTGTHRRESFEQEILFHFHFDTTLIWETELNGSRRKQRNRSIVKNIYSFWWLVKDNAMNSESIRSILKVRAAGIGTMACEGKGGFQDFQSFLLTKCNNGVSSDTGKEGQVEIQTFDY